MGNVPQPKLENPFDRITELFDEIKNLPNTINRLFTVTLKKIIWDPIDNGLIQPSIRFYETVNMYINCSLNKIENFWTCFIWYVLYLIQESIHIIIIIFLEIINGIMNINLLPLYSKLLDLYGYASDICYEYTGFELFIFPYSDSINEKCFVCNVDKNRKTPIFREYAKEAKKEIDTGINKFKSYIKYANDEIVQNI